MKAIRPSGTGFEYCINCYRGCSHGCIYCYARTMSLRNYESWLSPIPRLEVVDWLKRDVVTRKEEKIKDIFVCSACDAYQPLELRLQLTRGVVETLVANSLPFTVLTKNMNVIRDLKLFSSYGNCRVGFSLITLDESFKEEIEPYSSSVGERIEGLMILTKKGVSTLLSIEPILQHEASDPFEIVNTMRPYVDLFEFGKWSPYTKKGMPFSYDEQYYIELFRELIGFCVEKRVHYCIAKHTEPFLKRNGFTFVPHLLVTDRPYPEPFGSYMGKAF